MPNAWDWDKVTDDLCTHIAEGGTRASFAKAKGSPSMAEIFQNIGLNEERTAQVQAAYRFRAEAAADEVIDIRKRVETGQLDPAQARVLMSSLQKDIETMTGLATRAPQARQASQASDQSTKARLEAIYDAQDERD